MYSANSSLTGGIRAVGLGPPPRGWPWMKCVQMAVLKKSACAMWRETSPRPTGEADGDEVIMVLDHL